MKKIPLIFGLSGLRLTEEERGLFTKNQITGFILFGRNIESRLQLQNLLEDLRNLYDYKPLILIDQEGGKVARLKPPIIEKLYPAAASFGEIYDYNPEEAGQKVFDNYSSLMKDLQGLKIDSPCAPVADLQYIWADQVIGSRSFGKEVQKVVDLSKAAMEAIQKQGGIAIIKHIPGHGRARCDSHYDLPVIEASVDELNITDFEVFKQLSADNKDVWAMTSHIIYKALDPDKPVTLSKAAVDFIRNNIGFKGILITDDICMHALHTENCPNYLLVKQLLTLVKKQDINNPKYKEILGELIKQGNIKSNSTLDSGEQLMEQLIAALPTLQPVFTKSIVKVAMQAIEVGCDLVLHCSGNFQEMTAICDGLISKEKRFNLS